MSARPWRSRLPRGWHRQKDETIVCPHRDLSVCQACAAANREAVEIDSRHYWMRSEAEHAETMGAIEALRARRAS